VTDVTWLATPLGRLRLLLWLVAAHSVGVGLGLILHPPALLVWMGFEALCEPFFAVQGGVFHLVVAVAYGLAACAPARREPLIDFAVMTKSLAAVFLVLYWSRQPHLWSVLASGIVDGLMALAIVLARHRWRRADNDGRS
jgi:hypothetical protein